MEFEIGRFVKPKRLNCMRFTFEGRFPFDRPKRISDMNLHKHASKGKVEAEELFLVPEIRSADPLKVSNRRAARQTEKLNSVARMVRPEREMMLC